MKLLFDIFERTDARPAQHREHSYSYLNISARPMAELIRATLEQWFSGYPDDLKDEFKNDFITINDQSAFTELLVHQTLKQLNAESITVHPDIIDTDKKPDFKAILNNQEIVIEVKNSIDKDNPRIEEFCDQLNKRYSTTGYMLDLSFEGRFDTPISVRNFIQFLETQSKNLNIASLLELAGNYDQIPTWIFVCGENKIHIKPIPCRDPQKVYDIPIGITSPYSARFIDNAGALRKGLKKKASRYGDLGTTYLIVINFEEGFLDGINIAQALFGTEKFVFRGQKAEPDFQRENDGLWAENRNTRVSGIVVINGANPWSFWKRKPVIWLNPWASHPLDTTFFQGQFIIKAANEKTGKLEETAGLYFSEILGLDTDKWDRIFNQ